MRILCDENLAVTPALRAAASSLTTKPGRDIERGDLISIDALLVRSVTVVDASLLRHTAVKFVGTATAGVDHINHHDLQDLNIAFASAPGANANAVAEWVLGALAHSGALRALLESGVLGIVGFGHVGQRLHNLATRLGIRTLIYDPWITPASNVSVTNEVAQILNCTAVSLHASLHDNAPWPSRDLLEKIAIPAGARKRWVVNAGRGALLSQQTCDRLIEAGWRLCLDTWPDEPAIPPALLRNVDTASPHIAGYSKAAKTNATDALVASMQSFFGTLRLDSLEQQVPDTRVLSANHAPACEGDALTWLEQLLSNSSCIARDDKELRVQVSLGMSAQSFDSLRHNYAVRDELAGSELILSSPDQRLINWCEALEIKWRDSTAGK